MKNAGKISIDGITPFVDPTTGSGDIYMLPEAMGQDGKPFAFLVEDPPYKTRARHYHHGDVLYVYTKGEHVIEGEGTYRAGDIRWTRGGHVYGPETTGPEGGSWWVISYSDPLPIDAPEIVPEQNTSARITTSKNNLQRFARPYDWAKIDQCVQQAGGVILEGLLSPDDVATTNSEIDSFLANNQSQGLPASGSAPYDAFLGARTVRLHGLLAKISSARSIIGHEELMDWAERLIGPTAASIQLNAGELIQIGSNEPAQYLHRDSDSWLSLPRLKDPVIVNAIIALDPFTLENGATYTVPESWSWESGRQPKSDEFARATMAKGDALLFRGDIVHGGGENKSSASRRALSVSFCAGWLRPVENSFLNLSKEVARQLPNRLRDLLGYAPHDGVARRGGMLGLYENGSPTRALDAD
jgi:ectoine hydroxylase-related dioxygenase (phytanoyl-CoA dioxygenase family)